MGTPLVFTSLPFPRWNSIRLSVFSFFFLRLPQAGSCLGRSRVGVSCCLLELRRMGPELLLLSGPAAKGIVFAGLSLFVVTQRTTFLGSRQWGCLLPQTPQLLRSLLLQLLDLESLLPCLQQVQAHLLPLLVLRFHCFRLLPRLLAS